MSEPAETGDLGAPDPIIEYRGKYMLSLVIHNDPVYLRAEGVIVEFVDRARDSQAAAKATPIALYRVLNAGAANVYIMQATTLDDNAAQPGAFIGIQTGGEFAGSLIMARPENATRLVCEFGPGNTGRLLLKDYNRYLLIARAPNGQLAFYTPQKGSLWDNAWWTLAPYDVWRSDMSNADLRQIDLRGRSVVGTKFVGARLKWANFSGCDLTMADFTRANCTQTMFPGATLNDTKFHDAILNGAWLAGVNAWNVQAPNVKFVDVVFRYSGYGKPVFGRANLAGAVFHARDLTDADFREAILTDASMVECVLTGADFTGAKMDRFGLERAKCQRAKFDNATMVSARPNAAEMQGATFTKTVVSGADFSSATFDTATDFTGATLHGIEFSKCNLTQARFSPKPQFYTGTPSATARYTFMRSSTVPVALLGLDWTMLDLEGATLIGELPPDITGFVARFTKFPKQMRFTDRKINSANFGNATMTDANLERVKCDSSNPPDFNGAALRGATMIGMILPGAIFTNATLSGCRMMGSALVNAKFIGAHLNIEDAQSAADLSYCNLRDADFSNAYLDGGGDKPGANLANALFYGSGAKIANATLTLALFNNAYLGNVDFTGLSGKALRGVNFSNACLVNCIFRGDALLDCSLNNACLYGTDLTDVDLHGTKLNNAWISFNTEPRKLILKNMLLPSVDYKRTLFSEEKTDRTTNCPSIKFGVGPCKGQIAWTRDTPPPTEWTYQGRTISDADINSGS